MRKFLVVLWICLLIAAVGTGLLYGLFAVQNYLMDIFGNAAGSVITGVIFVGAFIVLLAALITQELE